MKLLIDALAFAASQHRTARRADGETPYINHPIEVVALLARTGRVGNENVLAAGALHDVIEDTSVSAPWLYSLFSRPITDMVLELTDDRSLAKRARRQKQVQDTAGLSIGAKHVRLADKISNVRSLIDRSPKWSEESKRRYLAFCVAVAAQLQGANAALEAVLQEEIIRAHKTLDREKLT